MKKQSQVPNEIYFKIKTDKPNGLAYIYVRVKIVGNKLDVCEFKYLDPNTYIYEHEDVLLKEAVKKISLSEKTFFVSKKELYFKKGEEIYENFTGTK